MYNILMYRKSNNRKVDKSRNISLHELYAAEQHVFVSVYFVLW